jgi:hypothetical protein
MKGFTQLQLIWAVVILGLLTALAVVARNYLNGIDERGYSRGVQETTAKWETRERKQQQAHVAEVEQLRAARDAALATYQVELDKALANYEKAKKGRDDEKVKNARVERDLRDGRLVFVDPGKPRAPAGGEACKCEGATGPPAAAIGDGAPDAQPGELSQGLAAALWDRATAADGVIEDLESRLNLAQDTILAYYHIARDCHAAK